MDYKKEKYPICILGDYNQRIPRNRQPEYVYEHLTDLLSAGFKTETSEKLDPEGKLLIDHISVTQELNLSIEEIHPTSTSDGLNLSDHVGIIANFEISGDSAFSETLLSNG